VLAARAAGGDEVEPELQYASELLYATLALHDVALGHQTGGRRRRLARKMLRRSVGWLGANQLLVRAMELGRHVREPGVLDAMLDTLRAFSDAQALATGVLEGEPFTREAWEEHAEGHTGALFSFCCRAGGLVSGVRPGELSALSQYGLHLGRMWHAAEDIVLFQGPEGVDKLFRRSLNGRPALPLCIAFEREPGLEAVWRHMVDELDVESARELMEGLRRTRAIQGCREVLAQQSWLARRALQRFEASPYLRALDGLAKSLVTAPFEPAPDDESA